MTRAERAAAFFSKAERLLRWARSTLEEMRLHARAARIDDVERSFFSLLAIVAAINDSLEDCAKLSGHTTWFTSLGDTRSSDQLLYYLWKARDSDVHDTVIKWQPRTDTMGRLTARIVDPVKAGPIANQFYIQSSEDEQMTRLLMYAFEVHTIEDLVTRMAFGFRPSPERVDQAGIEILEFVESFALGDFSVKVNGKLRLIVRPASHLGKPISPSADGAIMLAIGFYEGKLLELQKLLDASAHP